MTGHLLFLCLISVTAVSQADGTVHQDIIRYMGQIQIIRDKLAAEKCVDPVTHMVETREILGYSNHLYNIEMEVQRKQYLRLRDLLIECRIAGAKQRSGEVSTTTTQKASPERTSRKSSAQTTTSTPTTTMPRTRPTTTTIKPTTTTTATTTATTTPTTTIKPTTTITTTATTTPRPTSTPTPLPAMTFCLSATNLTESWRQDHGGSYIRAKNGASNCDTREMVAAGRPWFRFSGAAGNRLMNKCVPNLSCGTYAALWSDDPMPTQVGVITQVNVYGELRGNCRYYTMKISVVRCSTSGNDYVYRYDGPDYCNYGFCGMSE